MRAVSDISQRAVKWKDNNESEIQCVSRVALKCHFENVNHRLLTKGLREAASRWPQHGWFNTTAVMMNSAHYVVCFLFSHVQYTVKLPNEPHQQSKQVH